MILRFSIEEVCSENRPLVNIVRKRCAFVPRQTVPLEGRGVSSECSSTQNLFKRFKYLFCNSFGGADEAACAPQFSKNQRVFSVLHSAL